MTRRDRARAASRARGRRRRGPGSASAVSSWTAVAHEGRPAPGRRQAAAPEQRLDDRAADRHPLGLDPGGHAVVVEARAPPSPPTSAPGRAASATVDHGGDQRSGSSCRRPPARRAGSRVAASQPATAPSAAAHQVDDVRVDHLAPGRRRRAPRRSPRSARGRPGPGRRRRPRRPRGPARRCRCRPRSRGRRRASPRPPAAGPRGGRRAAGRPACSRASAVRKQDVGVGAEHRPRPRTQAGQLPGRAGVLRADLGPQPGQPGEQVGAVGEQSSRPRGRRRALRPAQPRQLGEGVGGRVVGHEPRACRTPGVTHLGDPVERLALSWVECQSTRAGA